MIHVVVGDLASVVTDAVVRPADVTLAAITPALRRFDAAAGPSFAKAIQTQTPLAPGAAVVTAAGELAAEFVIHAVAGHSETEMTPQILNRSIEAVLWQCAQWQIGSLALPGFAGGIGPLGAADVMNAIIDALRGPMRNPEFPATVMIVVDTPQERERYMARLGPDDAA